MIRARHAALAALALAAMPFAARAELPPSVYRDWQQRADEALTVRVAAVTTERRGGIHPDGATRTIVTKVEARAVVESVRRSASSLKPGATIAIVYERVDLPPNMVGARPIPILKVGDLVPAYLNRSPTSTSYTVAAQGASFESEIK
jgi:hypothetical protein